MIVAEPEPDAAEPPMDFCGAPSGAGGVGWPGCAGGGGAGGCDCAGCVGGGGAGGSGSEPGQGTDVLPSARKHVRPSKLTTLKPLGSVLGGHVIRIGIGGLHVATSGGGQSTCSAPQHT